jgi:hypothetical protein
MSLNHILEIVNIDNVIDRAALSAYLGWFLLTELAIPHGMIGSRIVDKDIRKYGICLAAALLLWAVGALVITLGVNLWRDHADVVGVWLMVFGSVLTVAGNLFLIRLLSVQRYGNWLWFLVTLINIAYTLWALS